MSLSPQIFKGCFVSSKIARVAMCFAAISTAISIHHTHRWLLYSVPAFANGVGFWGWFYFGMWIYVTWLSAVCFKSAICKSDRIFFGLLVLLFLANLLRDLAIFSTIRSAMLSMNLSHPEILYSVGIIRWVIGIAMYAVVLDHLFRFHETQLTEVQA
jgi:hypothetical protein